MKQYSIEGNPLFLKKGIIGLTDEQYSIRKENLNKRKKGEYTILKEVCFKIGEVIGITEKTVKQIIKTGAVKAIDDVKNTNRI